MMAYLTRKRFSNGGSTLVPKPNPLSQEERNQKVFNNYVEKLKYYLQGVDMPEWFVKDLVSKKAEELGIDLKADGGRIGFGEGSKDYDYKNPLQKNQYVMRTDEEIQEIIDDPKYKDYRRKDFRNEGILTRKETDRKGLQFKNFGKKKKKPQNIENVKRTEKIKTTQGSNISVRGSGQTGKQFSHVYPLIESAKPGTKTTFKIDAKMNRALEGYNKIGQTIAEQQEFLIKNKPEGYKQKIIELNAKAKKNVMNAIQNLGKDYKGQIGYFQVNPDTGEFKPKAGNYKMSFAGLEGENKIFKDMTGKERKDFERKISTIEKAKTIPGVTTADKIARPEQALIKESFKRLSKPGIMGALKASRFLPVVGAIATPALAAYGLYDAYKKGYTRPDELLASAAFGSGVSLKDKIKYAKSKKVATTDKQQEEADRLWEIEQKKMELDPDYIPKLIDPEEIKIAMSETPPEDKDGLASLMAW